MKVYFT